MKSRRKMILKMMMTKKSPPHLHLLKLVKKLSVSRLLQNLETRNVKQKSHLSSPPSSVRFIYPKLIRILLIYCYASFYSVFSEKVDSSPEALWEKSIVDFLKKNGRQPISNVAGKVKKPETLKATKYSQFLKVRYN